MFDIKSPVKTTENTSVTKDQTEKAGPSQARISSVRRSVGEGESGKPSATPKSSPPQMKPLSANTSGPKEKTTLETKQIESPKQKYQDRVAEAKACLTKAKMGLASSRNLRSDIKTNVTQAIERLFALVKEAETARIKQDKNGEKRPKERLKEKKTELLSNTTAVTTPPSTELMQALVDSIQSHSQLMAESNQYAQTLTGCLQSFSPPEPVSEPKTYAAMAASTKRTIHSIVISSEGESSGQIVEKIRTAVDAKKTGIKVERLRKARDQKVILGCTSKVEVEKIAQKIRTAGSKLKVEAIQNKDPLITMWDVLASQTDADIVEALKTQNKDLLESIPVSEQRFDIKFRRRARNPLQNHIVLRVSPQIWQCLTREGRVHIDLQRVRVTDQSPLVQCSLCLGYGHTRRLCTETVMKCTHCGGPHMRQECADRLAGVQPSCINCTHAKLADTGHNAFSDECPIRKKWDALARAEIAYC